MMKVVIHIMRGQAVRQTNRTNKKKDGTTERQSLNRQNDSQQEKQKDRQGEKEKERQ